MKIIGLNDIINAADSWVSTLVFKYYRIGSAMYNLLA